MVDLTKDWNIDQVLLAPGCVAEIIAHYRRREQELLEANNRYLERARAAEAAKANRVAVISGTEEELEELRTSLDRSEPGVIVATPAHSTHAGAAAKANIIARLLRAREALSHAALTPEQEEAFADALDAASEIVEAVISNSPPPSTHAAPIEIPGELEMFNGKLTKVVDASRTGWWRFHAHRDRDGYCDNPARGY